MEKRQGKGLVSLRLTPPRSVPGLPEAHSVPVPVLVPILVPIPGVKGVTLIELMVVIVIVSVLAAMILPQFGGTLEEARLSATARELVTTLKIAYSQAVTVNRKHRVRIDMERGRYWLEAFMESEGGDYAYVPAPGLSIASRTGEDVGIIDEHVSIEMQQDSSERAGRRSRRASSRDADGSVKSIMFYPDGTSDGERILLRDRQGFVVVIDVHPSTCRVSARQLGRDATP